MSHLERAEVSGLVLPVPPPEPPKKPEDDDILVCPRCMGPAKIGNQHESMYSFSCRCGGGRVSHDWCDQNAVRGITWGEPAPMWGTRPKPWEGYQ